MIQSKFSLTNFFQLCLCIYSVHIKTAEIYIYCGMFYSVFFFLLLLPSGPCWLCVYLSANSHAHRFAGFGGAWSAIVHETGAVRRVVESVRGYKSRDCPPPVQNRKLNIRELDVGRVACFPLHTRNEAWLRMPQHTRVDRGYTTEK